MLAKALRDFLSFPSTVKLHEIAVCTPAFIFLTFHSLTFYNLAYALTGCTEIFFQDYQQSLFCQKSSPLTSKAFRCFMLTTPTPSSFRLSPVTVHFQNSFFYLYFPATFYDSLNESISQRSVLFSFSIFLSFVTSCKFSVFVTAEIWINALEISVEGYRTVLKSLTVLWSSGYREMTRIVHGKSGFS